MAEVSYISGFPKRQLKYAKNNRDRAGEIEAQFENSPEKLPAELKTEHQQNVISSVAHSMGFLDGQKYWFIYRVDEREWGFEKPEELQQTGWNGIEDALVRMIEQIKGESTRLKGSKPYNHVKTLREFRNDLFHFESPRVKAGEEDGEYNPEPLLNKHNFPENPLGPNSVYPINWLSYELAERSVRMSFTLWRFFGQELGKEEEFMKGVPSP